MNSTLKKPIIFSDFDGTITNHDVIMMIMKRFAPPEWEKIKDDILYKRTINLKDGVEKLFNLIESSKKEEILNYIKKEVEIRDGFEDFIEYCEMSDLEFNVVSGGLDFMVETVLEKYKNRMKFHCNKGNFNTEKITVSYSYLPENCKVCGTCGCCKIEVIDKYPKENYQRIVIGDSLTDLEVSKVADLVFARADLIKYLDQEGFPYVPFETFYDIKEHLEKISVQSR